MAAPLHERMQVGPGRALRFTPVAEVGRRTERGRT